MSSYVVDASVAIKWFLPQLYADNARLLLTNNHNLLAPDLIFPEVGNILWKEVRFGLATAQEAKTVITAFSALPLQIYASKPLMSIAIDTALQTQRTVYDCLYLSLAVSEECQMVTADKKFYNALKNTHFATNLLWVEDI
ncbi:type II toxin-antitoxin system VapC family toxin [Calothrix sp. CCY 0018]|uniref:type II toxin-antitoxin system VapC family toxin n=1 Tax=Calothrix sp. CCY 0018 TaxID=3103864 RepID=UPI0039C6A70A